MKLRISALASSAFVIALALAGCSATGQNTPAGDSPSAHASAAASFNDSDVAFATGMVPHHQQAVEMVDIVLGKTGVDPRVTDLAKKIKAEQDPEIVAMTGWLKAWDQPAPSAMSGMTMDGMMSPDDMDALTKSSGPDSSRLFLQQMIAHHQGAIDMADEELSTGKNADAVDLAKSIVSSQTAEIATMNSLLESL